jgi:hypothetical protein
MTIDRFTWTIHAEDRLRQRGLVREVVEHTVQELHPIRETNQGAAEWRIDAGRFVVLYDYPDNGDIDAVRIVSAWSKPRRRRRPSESYP